MLDRLETLVGNNNIEKLKNTTILIIGLGGVGGYALESIVRSAVGKVIIVDKDIIDITNLNRQIIATKNNIGLNKADVAEQRINEISNTKVIKIKEYITKDNIEILFNEKIDYIIDACDTIETKIELIKESLKRNIKIISCMGTAKKMDPSLLKIIDIRKTTTDPIARIIRKKLNDENIKEKVMVVSSDETPININKLGSNSFVPAVAGLLCASYVINDIVGDVNETN